MPQFKEGDVVRYLGGSMALDEDLKVGDDGRVDYVSEDGRETSIALYCQSCGRTHQFEMEAMELAFFRINGPSLFRRGS